MKNRNMLAGLAVAVMMVFGVPAKAADWETDFAKASASAGKSGRYMLLDFSGSDWCGWCMKLDEEVFSQAEFEKYAKDNLVCVIVDFPQQKKQDEKLQAQNADLASKYGINGYPTVVILSPDGELVGTTGYQQGGARKYVGSLQAMIAQYEKTHPKKEAVKKPASSGKPKTDGGK